MNESDHLKLNESTPSLASVCRAVEKRTREVAELSALSLPIVLLSDFEGLPKTQAGNAIRLNPAVYQRLQQRILINGSKFDPLDPDVAQAVIAHEIGHAVCHRDSLMERPAYRSLYECIVAELLACKWGFFDELKKDRLESYGSKYCEILELWQDGLEFVSRMDRWYQRRLAGIR